jgi:hypothetical protein
MKMKTIALRNEFHNTSARVRVNESGETLLRASTVRRIRRALCGLKDCTCGGALGQRGHHEGVERIESMPGGESLIIMA